MSALPKISVITPSFNSIHTIRETLESVRSQDYPHVEHLVMDGGSKDGTVELLKEFPNLRWVSEKDEGHYHAMNKGIAAATGDIIQILNSDDCLRPGALSIVGRAFAEHPEWEALFGDVVYVDGKSDEIYRRKEVIFDYDVLRFSGIGYVVHPTLFVRKSLHDRLGLYNYKRFVNCCDGDWLLRIGQAKCRVGHVPAFVVNYRFHQFGQSADMRVQRNTEREWRLIRSEHGVPMDWRGTILRAAYRGKRQWQKLIHLGKIDLVPGKWILRRMMQPTTSFTSNIDMAKFDGKQP
jgi:glycosyltransferase involved in cell wall biosynthesis